MNLKYHLALLLANIAYGANYSLLYSLVDTKLGIDGLYFMRSAILMLTFLPLMIIKKSYKIELRDIWKMGIVALLIIVGRIYLLLLGMQYTSPIDGSIISTLSPLVMVIATALIFQSKIERSNTIGVALGFIGAVILIVSSSKGSSSGRNEILGNVIIFVAMIFSVLNTLWVKRLYKKYQRETILGWAYSLGMLFVVPMTAKELFAINFSLIEPRQWSELAIYLLFGTVISTFLLYYGLSGVSALAAMVYIYIQPVVATLLAIFRGQDSLDTATIISASLIFVALALMVRRGRATS